MPYIDTGIDVPHPLLQTGTGPGVEIITGLGWSPLEGVHLAPPPATATPGVSTGHFS